MRFVNDVSNDAHFKVMQTCKPGMYEYQLEANFLHSCYYEGMCRHSAYTSICGCGPNSAVLHYGHAGAPNDRLISNGDMLLLDMGAERFCYASDITCSFPANGKFTEEQKLIFNTVAAMQDAVFNALKPGVCWKDMHALAYRVAAEHLVAGGLLIGSIDEIMEANLMATFQPHGLGHFMGMEVHDVGGYIDGSERDKRAGFKSLRTTRTMETGMIITVEPGIYFIDILLKRAYEDPNLSKFLVKDIIDRYKKFGGVRLEDDVIITHNGMRNMTNCPRTVEDVEDVMSGKILNRSQLMRKYYW